MKKVLFVNGCIRGANSRTLRLAQRLVRQIPDAEVEVLALPPLHLTKPLPSAMHSLRPAHSMSLFSHWPTNSARRTQSCSPARSGI